jgi:hypothetical protein
MRSMTPRRTMNGSCSLSRACTARPRRADKVHRQTARSTSSTTTYALLDAEVHKLCTAGAQPDLQVQRLVRDAVDVVAHEASELLRGAHRQSQTTATPSHFQIQYCKAERPTPNPPAEVRTDIRNRTQGRTHTARLRLSTTPRPCPHTLHHAPHGSNTHRRKELLEHLRRRFEVAPVGACFDSTAIGRDS